MAYERELEPLLRWVRENPGLTVSGLEETIRAIPWPSGDPRNWKPPYEGTRMETPAIGCISWKLRYMELTGDVRQVRGKWWASDA